IHIFTSAQHSNMTELALNSSIKILDFYENYFNIRYPLPKLDLVAIPDLQLAGMENWGLITYRTTSLLFDSNQDVTRKIDVLISIAHEFAHQWFGNLVTIKWWDNIWLNEGFASFIAWLGIKAVEPDFDMNQYAVLKNLLTALHMDAFPTSHAIENRLKCPKEINTVFDSITYDKGSTILRMLQHVLGKEQFRERLCNYLKKFSYSNAQTEDLWEMLSLDGPEQNRSQSTEPDFPVATVMNTWTKQSQHPLVTIKLEGTTVTATQELYVTSPNITQLKASPFNYKWYIPLTYVTSLKPNSLETVWMNMTSATFQVEKGTKWVKGNYQCIGFYRVNYDEASWKSIITELKTNFQ
ncbi:hypothetical protein Ahia01_000385700, partial [Argonauta hians]